MVSYGLKKELLNPRKRRIVNKLIRRGATNIHLIGDKFSFDYGGKHYEFEAVKEKHLGWVGQWGRGKSKKLYYDDDVPPRYVKPLLTHEGVESIGAKEYGLNPWVDAHYVATKVEDKAVKHLGINPDRYAWTIEKIYRIEMRKDKSKLAGKKVQQ